jgi:hypothetical protein
MPGGHEGNAIVRADGERQSALMEQVLERGKCKVFARGFERLAEQQIARGMVADGQRIAVGLVAELKLAFVIDTPEIVGGLAQ